MEKHRKIRNLLQKIVDKVPGDVYIRCVSCFVMTFTPALQRFEVENLRGKLGEDR